MEFTVKYRGQDGRADYIVVQANSRSEVFPILKDKGITAISITEGATVPRATKNSSAPNRFKGLIAGVLVVVASIGLYFAFFNSAKDPVSTLKPDGESKVEKFRKPRADKPVKQIQTSSGTNAAPKEVAPSKAQAIDPKAKLDFTATTNAQGEVMQRWRTPDGKTHARLVPPKPLFNNVIDQTLSIVLSVPKGHTLPPMPGLGPNATKEFAEALKKPIVINEDDPEDVKRAKLLVQAGREAIFDALESGKSVNEIISEHCAAVNDNAEMHNTVSAEYRKLIAEGDLEGAETYRQEANKILEKSGAEPVQQQGSSPRRKSQQKGSDQ